MCVCGLSRLLLADEGVPLKRSMSHVIIFCKPDLYFYTYVSIHILRDLEAVACRKKGVGELRRMRRSSVSNISLYGGGYQSKLVSTGNYSWGDGNTQSRNITEVGPGFPFVPARRCLEFRLFHTPDLAHILIAKPYLISYMFSHGHPETR